MRFMLPLVALLALVACGGKTPTSATTSPTGEPAWSTFTKPLTATPNPATTRSAISFTTQIQVNQGGSVITGTDTYLLQYPDGHQVTCQVLPGVLDFKNTYNLTGLCDVFKAGDPVGDYIGILIHEESGNGFSKKFDPVTVTVHVTKG